ncbi:MAG: undecaprenyl-diphosphatase [Acetobacteraceae bacterium SCN 69-10]|nr:MAG: undecaprenyl-diphosphatase [Acetobacteraceae bacterium SCN 69-10]OJY73083.1 MAG: undecaprenyl-diphosphatase [Rhodospirillales bacterium 70-18]
MTFQTYAEALLLGLLEGLTEFIPVSSTGHLILASRLLGFQGPPGFVFEVAIQLGAILAVCVLYARRLLGVALGLAGDPAARHFALAVLVAFLPAAMIGALAHGFIKGVLFSPYVVAASLILGGVAILAIERVVPPARVGSIAALGLGRALGIGFCQTVAMIPGVSRSGATIMGALLLGVDRRTATEFSFFLAIPTMLGATAYDLYKNRATLTADGGLLIALGFAAAFVAALLVVRALVGYVARHGFAPFAYYRIGVGAVALAALLAG